MPHAPHYDFAHATAALLAIAVLLGGLALLAVKQVHEQVRVYSVQSVFAAGYTLLVGVDRVNAALIVLAVWTAVIKVIVIPNRSTARSRDRCQSTRYHSSSRCRCPC